MVTQWYSSFAIPQLQPDPNLSLYLFQDKALEQLVYATQIQWLGVENGSANGNGDSGAAARKENGVLRWLGESVLRGLTGVLLTTMFPELEVGPLDHVRTALETKTFYAHLARVIGLHSKLTALNYATSDSDRILGSLFASYIGAIHRDMGVTGSSNLYNWFSQLVGPYAQAYKTFYDQYAATPRPLTTLTILPLAPGLAATTPTSEQGLIAMDMTGMNPASTEAKLRRQNVSIYTSRLMEYAAKTHQSQPSFMFKDNGYQGALIQWTATVAMDGRNIATAVASTKLEAKHLASRDALVALRAPMGPLPSVRRSKKLNERSIRGLMGAKGLPKF